MYKPISSLLLFLGFLTMSHAADATDPLMRAAGTREYRPPKDTVETIVKAEIGQNDGRALFATIFRPKASSAEPLPAIVFIHGGGWRSGSHYNLFGSWLAERGYVVASIDYRLSKEAPWPAQIKDCKLGIRWLRANAAKYHIDANRIGVWGTSAGGHLAACVGTMYDDAALDGPGFEGVSSRPQAVAAFCPPTDFTGDWLKAGLAYPAWVVDLFRVPREENPELWKQASPAQAVKPGAPPFLIAHGEDDTHVPFTQGEKLKNALVAQGNSVEWIPIKKAGHDFFLTATTPDSAIEPDHEVIMAALLTFFDKNLKEPAVPK